ncbi:efflux RND transporter periplasmic adaptor subunit [Chloroflexota bacterium]
MKYWKVVVILALCLILVGLVACSPFGGDETEVSRQPVEVMRGDLMVSVNGSGNIGLTDEDKLAFTASGKISEILVSEDDKVTRGQVLARLDTDALELAVLNAEIALDQAEYNSDKAQEIYKWPDLEIAEAEVEDDEAYLEYALDNLGRATTPEAQASWMAVVARVQVSLAAAEKILEAKLAGYDTEEVAISKRLVDVARENLEQARKQLDEMTITAPFAGVIIDVSADEGDIVPSPALASKTIFHLVDLTNLELEVGIDEIDIPLVEPGQEAVISIDALPDVELKGEVISIHPLPRPQADVVLYSVTVSFDNSEDSAVMVGMSASVDIIIERHSDVLLVSNRAIKEDSLGRPVVKVMVGEEVEERAVVIGISDGFDTEIISGLSEGEVVVIETKVAASSSGGLFG